MHIESAEEQADAPARADAYRWYALGLLCAVYVFNVADRHIFSILAEAVKKDLNLLDWQVGVLIGPAIALFYAIVGVLIARVADRLHRVRFVAMCLIIWSGFTALGAVVSGFITLALTRVGVSVAEAGATPSSSSILADLFEPGRRPFVMGIFGACSAVGVMVSFTLGGFVAEHYGWRTALLAAAVPGVVLAIVMLATLREPERGKQDGKGATRDDLSLWQVIKALWRIPLYRQMVVIAGCANFATHGILNWGPSLLMRKFDAGAAEVGGMLGVGLAIFGASSILTAGAVSERLIKKSFGHAVAVAGWGQLAAVPLTAAALYMDSIYACVVLLCLAYGAMCFFIPMFWVINQSLPPPSMRATAAAIGLLSLAIVGSGIAPPLIGLFSDLLRSTYGEESLQYSFVIVSVMNLIVAALLFRSAGMAKTEMGAT